MSNDDETVERVARALAAEASTTEMGAAGFNAIHRTEYVEICWRDHEDRARAALSAMPECELLREADLVGKLLCWLRLHNHKMLGYGFNSTVSVECVRCKKRGVVSIWGTRP